MSEPERIFAIGDVHGCLAELEHLLRRIAPTSEDLVIFLGDLINRGPDPAGVLRLARSLPRARCLIGNHELRLLKYRRNSNPGILKPYDWETIHQLDDDLWTFMTTFETSIYLSETDTVLVHGGFVPWRNWQEQEMELVTEVQVVDADAQSAGKRSDLSNGRSWQDLWKGPTYAVCGHTPRKQTYETKYSICLDTSCVYGGRLSALEIRKRTLTQVPALASYVSKQMPGR